MLSRTGTEFHNLNHIREQIKQLNLSDTIVLDGELGSFGPSAKLDFQTTTSLVKRKENLSIDAKEKEVNFIIFDCFDHSNPNLIYTERQTLLDQIMIHPDKIPNIILSKMFREGKEILTTIEDVHQAHDKYVELGFEGLILRADNIYQPDKRSKHLLKFKRFIDAEFIITNFKSAKGKDEGTVVFECQTTDGKVFDVRPTGTIEKRQEMFLNGAVLIGKKITVRYQELTNEGIPRFPTGAPVRPTILSLPSLD